MKEQILKFLSSKKMVLSTYLIKVALNNKLSLNEFLVLVYFDNCFNTRIDYKKLEDVVVVSPDHGGVTRARKLVVLIGREDVIKEMVDNERTTIRYSSLREKLSGENEDE